MSDSKQDLNPGPLIFVVLRSDTLRHRYISSEEASSALGVVTGLESYPNGHSTRQKILFD